MDFLYQYIWTPVAVFFVGYILFRIMGKKAVAEMNSFDLLVILVLGTAISEPVVTKKLGLASYYSAAIASVYIIFSYLALNNKLKGLLHSSPTILIDKGNIQEDGLKKTKLTVDELLAEVRLKGYTKISDVELAVMEEVGRVSIVPKAEARPVQPSDIQLTPTPASIPVPLIIDGKIIDPNLNYLKKDKDWLFQQLKMYGIDKNNIDQVTLATYNEQSAQLEMDREGPPAERQGLTSQRS